MARTFKRREPLVAMSDINVTPLMDLAFVLLIVFMVAAPLLEEQSIDVNLPSESARPQNDKKPDFKTVSIKGDGSYYWGTQRVSKQELSGLLDPLGKRDNPPVISIKADAEIGYQSVVTLIDILKEHNLSRISLATQPGE